jgi:rhamnose transport system ATP-binding protein
LLSLLPLMSQSATAFTRKMGGGSLDRQRDVRPIFTVESVSENPEIIRASKDVPRQIDAVTDRDPGDAEDAVRASPESGDVIPIVEMRNIGKSFDATQALDDVSLALYPGEIHALLGENGAGKSTLIKIMTGVHQPDRGEIVLAGQVVAIHNAAEAQRLGIAAIYQEPLLFPDLNVAENIFISHQDRGQVVGWGRMFQEAEALLAELGVALDVRSLARGLTLAAQQTVEIAKAISLKVRVLILDEPTASLSAHEVEQLFKLVLGLRRQGVAILFVSHRIEEVFQVADKVTVFRDGRCISTRPRSETSSQRSIAEMVGREMSLLQPRPPAALGELLLSVRGLSREGVFEDVNFDLHRGEVLGFGGLIGAGRTDVGLALFGIEPATAGTIVLNGKTVTINSPREGMRLGIAYASEDRRQIGLSLPMSISANISLPVLVRYLNRVGLVRTSLEKATAEAFRKRLAIRTPSVELAVAKLSGGNQQKVMLSKWLNTRPSVMILDEPTRGIDVGAKAEVHNMISELAAEGIGIILISSDLPEVLAMSDRVLVMREGRQMAILNRHEANQESVMTAAMGQTSTRPTEGATT